MKNTSILESLKKIYTKMTGKKVVKRKNETDILSDIAESYTPNQTGGGSKLYKHDIIIMDSNDDGAGMLTILSSNNDEAETIDDLQTLLGSSCISGIFFTNDGAVVASYVKENNIVVYYGNAGNNVSITSQLGYYVIDSITPL